MTAYRFQFRSSFAGFVDYDVFDGRQSIGRVTVRVTPLCDYWRAHSNYPAYEESALNVLRWSGILPGSALSAPLDMVEAFNAWRATEYEAAKVEAARRWPNDWQVYFPAPSAPAIAARYDAGTGLYDRSADCAVAA